MLNRKLNFIFSLFIVLTHLSCGKSAINLINQGNLPTNNPPTLSMPALTIISAQTMDTNNNGYIDHYQITFSENVDDSTFPGYVNTGTLGATQTYINIAGYTNVQINPTLGADIDDDAIIYLSFSEGSTWDTGATPDITTISGSGLTSLDLGDTLQVIASGDVTEVDGVAPLLMLAKARKLENRVRLYFSEAVYTNAGGSGNLVAGDFSYTNAGAGDASSINSVLDGNGSNGVVVLKTAGATHGYFQNADLSNDQISVNATEIYDAVGNVAPAVPATIARRHGIDFTGDGVDDLIAFSSNHDIAGPISNAGAVKVYTGGSFSASQADSTYNYIFEGTTASAAIGEGNRQAACDFNNDGVDDIFVVDDNADAGGTDRGQAYLFYGGTFSEGSYDISNASVTISSTVDNGWLGSGLACGDVNGDGIDDLIISMVLDTVNTQGDVLIYYGSSSPSASMTEANRDVRISGTENAAWFLMPSYVSDINNDGIGDFIVGAPQAASGGTTRGNIQIFFGDAAFAANINDTNRDSIIVGTTNFKFLGLSVYTAIGDFNNDNISDFLLGQTGDVANSITYGKGVWAASYNDSVFGDVIFTGWSGAKPASFAGDLNGDGAEDVLWANQMDSTACAVCGEAYVTYGGALGATETIAAADITLSGTSGVMDIFGSCALMGPDYNNDGTSDILVYSTENSNSYEGKFFIWDGSNLVGDENDTSSEFIFDGVTTDSAPRYVRFF